MSDRVEAVARVYCVLIKRSWPGNGPMGSGASNSTSAHSVHLDKEGAEEEIAVLGERGIRATWELAKFKENPHAAALTGTTQETGG